MPTKYELCAQCNSWLDTQWNAYDVLKDPEGHTVFAHHAWCSERMQDDYSYELVETIHREGVK